METLRGKIKDYLIEQGGKIELHEKKSFWCTDSETSNFELFHRLKGTPPTNIKTPEDVISLGYRKLIELSIVDVLRGMDVLVDAGNEEQFRVDMKRTGKYGEIQITGYTDAIIKSSAGNIPVEIKTAYGRFNKESLDKNQPKSNYVKQVIQYMDFMNSDYGKLFITYFSDAFIMDEIYEFDVYRDKDDHNKYSCMGVEYNLQDIYDKYSDCWYNYFLKDIEPVYEYQYKFPIASVDWHKVPANKISDARNNHATIGDWNPRYSEYKNLIIEKEAQRYGKTFMDYMGYTDEEINLIKEATKGYSTWNK